MPGQGRGLAKAKASWPSLRGAPQSEIRPACGHRSSDAVHDNTLRPPMDEVKGISGDLRWRHADHAGGLPCRCDACLPAFKVYPPWRAVSAVKRAASGEPRAANPGRRFPNPGRGPPTAILAVSSPSVRQPLSRSVPFLLHFPLHWHGSCAHGVMPIRP